MNPSTLISSTRPNVSSSQYRHTKIIATLGPATESKEQLTRLINAGVDVVRLNMAHASQQWVADTIWHIREVSNQVGREVAIMMDVKGPEIRTGLLDSSIKLNVGDHLEFYTSKDERKDDGSVPRISVNYPGLPNDVEVNATILVDSGLIKFRVVEKGKTYIRCETLTQGELGSRRHINLPGVRVNLPALTEKDNTDLQAGVAAVWILWRCRLYARQRTSCNCAACWTRWDPKQKSSQKLKIKPACETCKQSFKRPTESW